jgi:iron complex transport system substrate-binding protein
MKLLKTDIQAKGIIFLWLVFLVLLSQGIPCQGFAYPIEIKDGNSNKIIFNQKPRKIVSLVPSASEILFRLGAKNLIAGVTYHDATLADAQDKEVVGGFFRPSLEKIAALKPDLLIVSDLHKEIIQQYRGSGCRIFIYKTDSIAKAYENILTLGRIVDLKVEAEKIVSQTRKDLAHIQAKLDKLGHSEPRRVIRLMGRDTIMTPGNSSFQNEMIRAAGGIPPDFGKQGSIVPVTKEEWQAFNPQVIYGCTPDKEAAANFFTKPGWKDVDAVKNHQVYYFPCDLTCRASTMIGPFVSWLSSTIYTQEFANPENDVYPPGIFRSKPLQIDLDLVASASIIYSPIYDFENKTLKVDFTSPPPIISTREVKRDNIKTVGNHFLPPPTWSPSHHHGIEHIRALVRKAINREKQDISFLITGADMDNLSVQVQEFKEMKVVALVTAGVMSNAMRMAKDEGAYYEPGTINVIIMTNYQLSKRAMTRAIIAGTEAKTAALEDMDIRSSYTPRIHKATGTGTDNILVVQGQGGKIENTGGHSKMGELIARAVYKGVKEAVLKQNKVIAGRNIFQRLKERQITLYQLVNDADCGCLEKKKSDFSVLVEHLLLKPEFTGFMEASLAISDEYEKGLIRSLDSFDLWCRQVAENIAGEKIDTMENLVTDKSIPVVVRKALNGIMIGARIRLTKEDIQ